MASSNVQRKLTAILCTDVVGYSRLMGENEAATLRTLTEYRQLFADYIEKFRGRVVNAVNGAVEIQRNIISERVMGLPN